MEKRGINFRKILSIASSVLLCSVALISLCSSIILSVVAFSKNEGNTASLFGYSFYVSESDILGTEIEKDALIITKNSELSALSLNEALNSDYIVIKNLGGFILENGSWFLISLSVIPMLVFLIMLLSEGKKVLLRRNEKNLHQRLEFKESKEEIEQNLSAS